MTKHTLEENKSMENYLHEFMRVFFSNRKLIKRFFLLFVALTLLMTIAMKQSFEVTAEVIVQSKKLSQTDSTSSLAADTDKFIPTTIADMETESNILRSASLSRQTLIELINEGEFEKTNSLFTKLITNPIKNYLIAPFKLKIINPVKEFFGLEVDTIRDTALDALLAQTLEDLSVDTLPGSNIILVNFSTENPQQGTIFVQRLLKNYLKNRQDLQSNELPEIFYEQKKLHYKNKIDDLTNNRLNILINADASDPKEEITFRLNAINTEEQSLNTYYDQLLENKSWLEYLKSNLEQAQKLASTDYTFPFTFKQVIGSTAYEDREIKEIGDKLTQQISRFNVSSLAYTNTSLPIQEQRKELSTTHRQFLKIVANRITEREKEIDIIKSTIEQKTARINEYKDRVKTLQKIESHLRQLDTEIEALHKAFFAYTQRYEESLGANMIDESLSNARILSEPYEPTEAAFPKPKVMIPLGILTALLLSISLGYVKEFFDHSFKLPAHITEHLGLPILLVIDAESEPVSNIHKPGTFAWLWDWIKK